MMVVLVFHDYQASQVIRVNQGIEEFPFQKPIDVVYLLAIQCYCSRRTCLFWPSRKLLDLEHGRSCENILGEKLPLHLGGSD